MVSRNLEKRIKALEETLAEIQNALVTERGTRDKDWRRAVEKYAGDEDLLHVFAEAQKLREMERTKSRRSGPKSRRSGS